MAQLAPLQSPYIQELPPELIPRGFHHRLACANAQEWRVLLDVLHRDVFLVEHKVLCGLTGTSRETPEQRCGYRQSRFCGIEVEINSHCNLRCSFCPVSFAPHPRRMMPLDQFRYIVSQAVSCGMTEISLNHYSEPTLHPLIGEIVTSAVDASLKVTLFTNGTALCRDLVDRLAPFRDVIAVVINIASSDPDEYHRITKKPLLGKVLQNARDAAQELCVEIVINNSDEQSVVRMQDVVPGISVTLWRTDDRAGLVDIEGIPSQYHSGLLNGCPLAIRYINVSVEGDVFLCPQDYWKSHIMGNIYKEPLEVILRSDEAWQFRRWVFGIEKAPDDWICRRCSWTAERKVRFSVGAPLSDVDMGVYGNIVRQSSPTLIWLENGKPRFKHCET